MLTIPAGEFKAKCLSLMDLAHNQREVIVVTKRGIPIAKLVPYEDVPQPIFGYMKNTITIKGDIVSPIEEDWDVLSEDE
jgi:prevent-host-death family protein